MITKQFGELELVRDYYPKGIVIFEDENGVVLEEYLDTSGQDAKILYKFEEGYSLQNKEHLYNCLVIARIFEKDLTVPIYIKRYESARNENSEESLKQKKVCFECLIEWTKNRPWLMTPTSKCEQCTARLNF